MNIKHINKVASICEQLKKNANNYTLIVQLGTVVNYRCMDCSMFLKNDGNCYGKPNNQPCLYSDI